MKISEEKECSTIIDCAHLIDLPPVNNLFNAKQKGNVIKHPLAKIRILKVLYPKNGLYNLL